MKSFKQYLFEATAATTIDVLDNNGKKLDTIGWNLKMFGENDHRFIKKFIKDMYKNAVQIKIKIRSGKETIEKL